MLTIIDVNLLNVANTQMNSQFVSDTMHIPTGFRGRKKTGRTKSPPFVSYIIEPIMLTVY